MSENNTLSLFISRYKEQELLKNKSFPLDALIAIYCKAKPYSLYVEYFANLKLLINWLAPIDCSKYTAREVMYPLYNYEQQEIAALLQVHPSIIQQAFLNYYGYQIKES